MLEDSKVIDKKLLKPEEAQEEYAITNRSSAKFPGLNHLNTIDRLVRFEFLEFIVWIAAAKYKTRKICATYCDSVTTMFREGFEDFLWTFDFSKWQRDSLYHPEVNAMLKDNETVLREFYKTHSGKYCSIGM